MAAAAARRPKSWGKSSFALGVKQSGKDNGFVAIFATFGELAGQLGSIILPNQGLGRKIKCELSRLEAPFVREAGHGFRPNSASPRGPSMPLNTRSTVLFSAYRLSRLSPGRPKNDCSPSGGLAQPGWGTRAAAAVGTCTFLCVALASSAAWAQGQAITPAQRSTANMVAQSGVPLSELASTAPDSHTVKSGDTLWAISKIFLTSPWRWPELWGMNFEDIKNPHRIYPGQVLYLDKSGGRARLSARKPGEGDTPTVRVSPRVRSQSLSESAIPPVNLQAVEAFLAEPLVVDETTLSRAARIVATPENRVLLSLGDRAYARGQYGNPGDLTEQALTMEPGKPRKFRVFRNVVPLKDPYTGEVLAYEAHFLGKAQLVRPESRSEPPVSALPVKPVGKDSYKPQFENTAHNIERVPLTEPVPVKSPVSGDLIPASIDIVSAKEEMRVGDRLLPEPPREFTNFVPRAPGKAQSGAVVSVYGNAVRYAAQNQVVAINRGKAHGLEDGHVLALVRDSSTLIDKTDDSRPQLRLPGEFNGLMMVFRTFDKVSYALVLEIQDGVKIGDRFTSP